MHLIITLVTFSFIAAAAAVPALTGQTKVVGAKLAVISQYPSTVSLLYAADGRNFYQSCVGTILTTKSIVTTGHCLHGDIVNKWRSRVGSSFSNSGGVVYLLNSFFIHPNFNIRTMDNDIAIIRTAAPIVYSNVVKAASIAGALYNLTDNQVVWAAGFGASVNGSSEQLRHIQIWTVNQATCTTRYKYIGSNVTANMVCAGLLKTDSSSQCVADSGGPLFHNGVVVGIYSWGFSCASALYPGINTRISRFTSWIQANSS